MCPFVAQSGRVAAAEPRYTRMLSPSRTVQNPFEPSRSSRPCSSRLRPLPSRSPCRQPTSRKPTRRRPPIDRPARPGRPPAVRPPVVQRTVAVRSTASRQNAARLTTTRLTTTQLTTTQPVTTQPVTIPSAVFSATLRALRGQP